GEARALGRAALERATTPEHLAILHLGLAQLDLDDDQRSAAQHARSALALPGLPRDLRLRLRIVLSVGLMLSGNAASEGLDEALVEGLSSSDPATERAALLGSCVAAYLRRDFGEALSYANRARATGAGAEPAAQTLFFASRNAAELWGARVRAVVGEVHEALEVTDDGVDVARRDGRTHDLRSWMATRARALLACGRPQDACREAEAVLEMLEGAGDAGGVAEAARYTMGRAALHGGGPDGARVASRTATALMAADTPAARRAGRWLMAQAVDAQGDQGAAVEFLDETLLAPGGARVDHESPDDAFIAMRILSRAGALDRAETVVAECERQARRNPGSPWLQTTASHARALLVRDISGLRASIDAVPDMPSPLLGAEVLEDAAWVFRDGEPDEAVTFLDRALELHLAAGAEGDAHRVRQKLRELGIRRQRASRAVSPWGLTEAEVVVAELIARGCTNREAAQRLFLSQHTVSTHLRHTFEKLGIHSRVELAMLFGDRVATSGDRRQVA
ncbi:MAG: LuxR family transcriptional regulator, partial [Conexibacter sp.]|nr:LuxR family transcriptional regulator [Conexibacter sp.]